MARSLISWVSPTTPAMVLDPWSLSDYSPADWQGGWAQLGKLEKWRTDGSKEALTTGNDTWDVQGRKRKTQGRDMEGSVRGNPRPESMWQLWKHRSVKACTHMGPFCYCSFNPHSKSVTKYCHDTHFTDETWERLIYVYETEDLSNVGATIQRQAFQLPGLCSSLIGKVRRERCGLVPTFCGNV